MVTEEELKEAMKLNERLARKLAPNYADDLISEGNEKIVEMMSRYDPSKGTFTDLCARSLPHYHKRALIDILAGVHIPWTVACYSEKTEGIQRLDLDALENNFLTVTPAGEEGKDYSELYRAIEHLSPRFREVVERCTLDKEPAATVAADLGVTIPELYKMEEAARVPMQKAFSKRKPFQRSWQNLPRQWKETYERFCINGESAVSIAKSYGISKRAVYVRLNHAYRWLKPNGTRLGAPKKWHLLKPHLRNVIERVFCRGELVKDVARSINEPASKVNDWIRQARKRKVMKAPNRWKELPPKYREAVEMVYIQGKTRREVARALGVTPSLICYRLKRARRHFRRG